MLQSHTYVLNALKNSTLFSLLIKESYQATLKIMPEKTFVRLEMDDDGVINIHMVDEDRLMEGEEKRSVTINHYSIGDNDETPYIIRKRYLKYDAKRKTLIFCSDYHQLLSKNYHLELKSMPDYTIHVNLNSILEGVNVSRLKLSSFASDLSVQLKPYRLYSDIHDFLKNEPAHYLESYTSGSAFTSLMDEDLLELEDAQEQLDAIGFNAIAKRKESWFTTRSWGIRYYWEVLLRYCVMIHFRPSIMQDALSGRFEEIDKYLFLMDGTSFALMIQAWDETLAQEVANV